MNRLSNEARESFEDCRTFAGSIMFDRLFAEGMALVDETARYLDGRGREQSRAMPRNTEVLYAAESLRVTTRLLQTASWLLVQRAVHEGDMRFEDASRERYRIGSKEICLGETTEGLESLPLKLQELLRRSGALYRRIARLDEILFGTGAAEAGARGHLNRLEAALEDL